MYKKGLVVLSLILALAMVLSACTTPSTETPTTTEPGTGAAVTTEFKSADPTTFVTATIGEPDVLDPALDYETAGSEVNQNVYETLYFYNKGSAVDLVPMLATDYTLSDDGLTYVFTIRQGVKFHDGGTLEPTDVAYSLQRATLQSGTSSPSLLLTEPIIGIGKIDAADLIDPALEDDPEGLQAVPAADLLAACESVTSRIVADDAAGTVTVTLAQPYGPFMVTLAHTVASIVDKEWAVANGVWDGDCATWQNFYGLIQENDPIAEMANGTGPYKFVSWDHATKTVTLEAFDGYWRTEPLWEGAKTGVASVKTVLIKGIDEWGTRFSMLQAGDADFAVVNRANISQVDPLTGERADYDVATETFGEMKPTENPSGALRLFFGAPALSRSDILMNESVKVNVDEGSPFIGTGSIKSGRGIPVNFFENIHVRKAFNYCMDWDTYIKDYLLGEGTRVPYTLALPGELGFNAADPMYAYDPAKCEEEFKLAEFEEGTVWDNGFYMVATWNTGNTARKTALEILSASLLAVNGKFNVSVLGMPWAAMLRYYQAGKLPMYMIGWQEDIHDPHNWYSPYLVGTYGTNANFPEAVYADFKSFVDRGASATDPAERTAIYTELNAKVFDYAPFINGPLAVGRHYEQRWISGYYYNPLYGGFYYYELGKQ